MRPQSVSCLSQRFALLALKGVSKGASAMCKTCWRNSQPFSERLSLRQLPKVVFYYKTRKILRLGVPDAWVACGLSLSVLFRLIGNAASPLFVIVSCSRHSCICNNLRFVYGPHVLCCFCAILVLAKRQYGHPN